MISPAYTEKDLPGVLDKCTSVYQLYRLKDRKRTFSLENIEPWLGLWLAVHSVKSNCYYLREFISVKGQIESIKKHMKAGNLFIVWGEEEQDELNNMMDRVGVKDYWNEFIPLMELSIKLCRAKERKGTEGYFTKVNEIENEIKKITKKYK